MRAALVFLLMLGLFGCQAGPQTPEQSLVSGSVTYRERIALPPTAVLEVQLQDVSLADAPARVISEQRIESPGQVPIDFSIAYDPALIKPVNRYALQARIEVDGQLWFINDTNTPVLTHDAPEQADMWLVRVMDDTKTSAGDRLNGMFVYLADAALFRDCRTGLSYPVAMEGAYLDLERAYTRARNETGEELQVIVRGRLLPRPPMEGDQERVHLIVDRFERIEPGVCEPQADATLVNTWWRLTHVDGEAVVVEEGGKEPHMVLELNSKRVRGNGGCNQFFGSYELKDGVLTFSGMGSTMMFCASGSDTEQQFFAALAQTDGYQVIGQVLKLMKGGVAIARFEAIYH